MTEGDQKFTKSFQQSICIFCKANSSTSKSEEHIVPESLGNKEIVLPAGFVCDNCNNYIGRKIEAPILQEPLFQNVRARQGIQSKSGQIPYLPALILGSGPGLIHFDGTSIAFKGKNDAESRRVIEDIKIGKAHGLMFTVAMDEAVNPSLMSRLLAKMGYEYLFLKVLDQPDLINQLLAEKLLDPIRRFVRIGDKPKKWPFHRRRIYEENRLHADGESEFQVLHEVDILRTPSGELYFIVALFGEEFAINIGGPAIDGYKKWLRKNKNVSPLYSGKNTKQMR